MFITLYKKCLELASHKSSNFFLGIVSFAESSFFPIPPDVMIVPMVIAITIGTIITSGGMGKKELSAKDTIPRKKLELLWDANSKHFL